MVEAEETRVLFESEDLVAVYKPKGLPTVPLNKSPEGDSLLSRLSSLYPEILAVSGRQSWEGGIIHRLDTPTSGIVIAARNQETYDELFLSQKRNEIIKYYTAVVKKSGNLLPGFEPFPYKWSGEEITIRSYFRSYGERGASVRPVLNIKRHVKGELYTTSVRKLSENIFGCVITRGFRHQIRSHLAWCSYPICGDDRYGGEDGKELLLEARKITFPLKGKVITVSISDRD